MTRRRLADLARGILALLALIAVVAGPPAALVTAVGWPLPTTIPALAALEDAVRSGVSDQFIIKSLATIAWIAWLQVGAAVVCELVALARRRPTTRLPVLPGLQPLVARLAAAALLVAATSTSRMPQAGALPVAEPTPPTGAAGAPVNPAPVRVFPAASQAVAVAESVQTITVTVERHDSYWAIAERALGDGLRWREIRDTNVGRTMPDGHVITSGSDLVRPGWILEVPASPPTVEPQAATPPLVPTGIEITVEAGEGFWDIAEEQVAAELGHAPSDDLIRPFWSALVDANRDRLADPTNPNLLFTGQRLTLVGPPTQPEQPAPPPVLEAPPPVAPAPPDPPDPSPPDTPEATPTTQASTPATVADAVPAAPAERPPGDPGDAEPAATEVVAAGLSTLLAVGAARSLVRRRRRRAHLHLIADRPTRPEDADVHREVLICADNIAIETLEVGLAHLARALRDANIKTAPVVVQHGGGQLDVYVDPPTTPPPGWTAADATTSVWTLDAAGAAVPPDWDPACPAPLLVTLGQPDDGGQLYLDLEAAGLVSINGDLAIAHDTARTMVAELALSPFAGAMDIIVIGDLGANVAELDHVRCVPHWNDVADDVWTWTSQTHQILEQNDWANPFVARAIAPDHDALAPLAVFATEPPPAELLAHLAGTGSYVAGIVLVGSDASDGLAISCSHDRIAVPVIGLEATPHPVDLAALDEIVALLEDPVGSGSEALEPTLFDASGSLEPEDVELAEPEVIVRVLGQIGVDGNYDLTTKQTAVLAFIALHGTVTAERVENAVWASPSTGSRRKRLNNTVSEVRAAIGRPQLPAAADGRYTTGPAVTTDAHIFDHLVRRAARETPELACITLRAALDVVSGPVFSYRDVDRASFTWVDLENLVSTWELRIAAVAERCAELYIDNGQPSQAAEVATRALTLIPTHTGITEALMRAHAANGDRLAVQRVFQAHASALEQLDIDDVADSTSELYDRLSQRSG